MNAGNANLLASIGEKQQQVDTLHMISVICLVVAIVLLVAAIAEFFLLDIYQIILIRTGKAAKKRIRQIDTENSKSKPLKKSEEQGHGMWNTAAPLVETGQPAADAGGGQTSLLTNEGGNLTTVLEQQSVQYDYSDANITMPLQEEVPVKIGKFSIVTNIMMIHTDEMI